MNSSALRRGAISIPSHHMTHAADDGAALGLRLEIDFHFDAFANFVMPVDLQKYAGHAEVHHLTGMPLHFCNRAHADGPRHVMAACAPDFRGSHL